MTPQHCCIHPVYPLNVSIHTQYVRLSTDPLSISQGYFLLNLKLQLFRLLVVLHPRTSHLTEWNDILTLLYSMAVFPLCMFREILQLY